MDSSPVASDELDTNAQADVEIDVTADEEVGQYEYEGKDENRSGMEIAEGDVDEDLEEIGDIGEVSEQVGEKKRKGRKCVINRDDSDGAYILLPKPAVKRLAKLNSEVKMVSEVNNVLSAKCQNSYIYKYTYALYQEAAALISKSLELFLETIIKNTNEITIANGRKSVKVTIDLLISIYLLLNKTLFCSGEKLDDLIVLMHCSKFRNKLEFLDDAFGPAV
jgi:histone H3/H4